MVKVIPVL